MEKYGSPTRHQGDKAKNDDAGNRAIRFLFFLTLAWGAAVFWIAPRPPLIDLPQHAGQVALLHDLVAGISPWTSIFRINLLTPYLIGYGLALPLSFIMPVGSALKVILSVAYVAFVLLGARLRAHFGADQRLDWLFFPVFFGFAYSWGFYTFLASAPLVILFVLAVDRYARQPLLKRGIAAMLIGLMLLLSHGLAFVFGAIVAGCLYTMHCYIGGGKWLKRWVREVWPLVIPGIACIIIYLLSVRIQLQYWAYGHLPMFWDISIMRLPRLLVNSIGDYYDPKILIAIPALGLLAAPWLLGLRINRRDPTTWVMLIIVLAVEILVPSTMISTGYVYQRFALFFLPAYVLIFTSSSSRPTAGGMVEAATARRSATMPMTVLIFCVWTILACHSWETWRFAQESKDFEEVLSATEPRQRMLSLTFAAKSDDADLKLPYRHYASWYQAEKHGLVDFNFAWFPPQIVRFRPDQLPKVKEGFSGQAFTAKKYPIEPYRYILARHTAPLPADLFKGADCVPRMVLERGSWTLFERDDCHITQHEAAKTLSVRG